MRDALNFGRCCDALFVALRICVFCFIFVAPVAAFASIASNTGGQASATGLVLFVSLQK